MATRSSIARLNADGTVSAIYCHWDGYISNNGHILKDHYTDPAKIDQLIELGALSSLRPEIGQQQSFDGLTNENWCLAYGRDRGETNTAARTYFNVQVWQDRAGQEYNYLWDGSEWHVSCYRTNGELRNLVQLILETNNQND